MFKSVCEWQSKIIINELKKHWNSPPTALCFCFQLTHSRNLSWVFCNFALWIPLLDNLCAEELTIKSEYSHYQITTLKGDACFFSSYRLWFQESHTFSCLFFSILSSYWSTCKWQRFYFYEWLSQHCFVFMCQWLWSRWREKLNMWRRWTVERQFSHLR